MATWHRLGLRDELLHKLSHLLEAHPKTPGAPPRVLGISTTRWMIVG